MSGPAQPCEFLENRIKTATYIITSYTYIFYIHISRLTLRIRRFVIRDFQNEKRDHPHPPTSGVESVRIVISFRNIAKNVKKNMN